MIRLWGLFVMRSSSSSLSVWDGDIIPRQLNSITPNLNINIPNALLYMKKKAYADSTIHAVGNRLKHLVKYCNLNSPELVKGEKLSEKLAKLRTKSYQANVYDFKKKYEKQTHK